MTRTINRQALPKVLLAVVAVVVLARACSTGGNGNDDRQGLGGVPEGCTTVDAAVSPEKVELLTKLAADFNESDEARAGGGCAFVRVQKKSSGQAATLLAGTWPEDTEGPRPVIWSPAASSWGAILN
ncbi:MAG: hypothetical protein ABIW46_04380, partial [Acidimicrobiales bacterium]